MDPCSVFHFLKTIVLWRLCQKICQTKVFWVLFFNFRKQADSDVYYLCITMTTTSPNSQQTLYYKWVLKTHTNQPFEWQSFNVPKSQKKSRNPNHLSICPYPMSILCLPNYLIKAFKLYKYNKKNRILNKA